MNLSWLTRRIGQQNHQNRIGKFQNFLTLSNQQLYILTLFKQYIPRLIIYQSIMIDLFLRTTSNLTNECANELAQVREEAIKYSGVNITSLGSFQDCIGLSKLKYGLLQVINKTTRMPVSSMGLCLPQKCQKTFIETTIEPLLDPLELQGKYIQSPELISYEKGAQFYIAIGCLCLIVFLIFVSTMFKKVRKNQFLDAFNLKNSIKIFQYKEHKLNVFNGLKGIFLLLIVYCHTVSTRKFHVINALTINDELKSPFALLFISGFLVVDVFFYISGFLLGYLFISNKTKSLLKYPITVLRRILKLWPSYIIAILIFYGIFAHLGSGPVWHKFSLFYSIQNCSPVWKSFLMIGNLIENGQKMCMEWSWYVHNDIQLFIVSVIVLYFYRWNRKATLIGIIIVIALSLVINFVLVHQAEHILFVRWNQLGKWKSYFRQIYIKPWVRCSPYLYGLALGILYSQFIEQEKERKQRKGLLSKLKEILQQSAIKRGLFSLFGLCIVILVFTCPRPLQLEYKWDQSIHSLYLSTAKLFFVIGFSILTLPSLLGFKDCLFYKLMDNRVSFFLSKISYWLYLAHYFVIIHICFSQKTDYFYSLSNLFSTYLLCLVISIAFAVMGTLFIEIPFNKIEKLVFEGKSKKSEKINQQTDFNSKNKGRVSNRADDQNPQQNKYD